VRLISTNSAASANLILGVKFTDGLEVVARLSCSLRRRLTDEAITNNRR
jgi:hypothetical protein